MIYLSRLLLNPRHRQVQHDLADCHHLHRTVLRGFPASPDTGSPRDHFGVLHRLDSIQQPRLRIALLVQSSVEPEWAFLPAGYLEAGTSSAVKCVDDAYAAITRGSTLRFRLRANPTKRVWKIDEGTDERWKGRRVDLRREDDQLAWLERKGQVDPDRRSGGFRLLDVQVRPDQNANRPRVANLSMTPGGAVHGRRQGSTLAFGSVLFDGILRVTDADAFKNTLLHGIGSGKAYGFGLLSVAPA